MSAPKEPGKADSAGNGPADASQRPPARTGRITETGEAPPWQRGGPTRPAAPARAADGGVAGRPPGADERARRYVSGTAAPAATGAPSGPQQGQAKPPAPPVKPAVKAPPPAKPNDDAYASELPDLSEPAQRRPPVRRPQVSAGPRGPVRASLQIRRIDPWSALKVSLLLSTALFFVWMIAVAVLYVALGAMGVWSKLNSNVGDLLTNNSAAELVSASSIFGGAALVGLVNVVVLTALATLGAVIYNLSTDVVGGVEVTLADRD